MASVFQKCKTDKQDKNYPCTKTRCKHSWTVMYREPGGRSGRQREKSFPHGTPGGPNKAAEAFAKKVEADKLEGIYLDPDRGKITVRAWWNEWLEPQSLAPNTLRDYEGFASNYLIPTIGRKTIAGVTPLDAQRVVKAMQDAGLKSTTIRTRVTPMKAMFKAAMDNERIGKDPSRNLVLPRIAAQAVNEDDIPTPEEVVALAKEMPDEYELAVWLIAGAGPRPSEAFAASADCRRGDIYRIHRQTTEKGDGKGNRKAIIPLKHRAEGDYRDTPLAPWLDAKISHHIARFGTRTILGTSGLFFATKDGALLTNEGFFYHWKRARKKLGLAYTPHDLRHFFASTMLAAGCSLLEVSRWLGHRSIRVTADTYGHLVPSSWDRGRGAMEAAMGPLTTLGSGAPSGPEELAQAA
ncbi:tyrosine-type recombinase/integrase [Streptomyces luteireticuli]|uniref:Site-specific integrase n=1 Tax=Streptomyces luteireticuli TaxID=173858 RepID=A0ABN0YRC3_9ACTN